MDSTAEWIGSLSTAGSVIVAMVVFRLTAKTSSQQNALSLKPHLTFDHDQIRDEGTWQVSATNIGKGPALECRYIGYVGGHFYRARAFAVAAQTALIHTRSAIALSEPSDTAAIRFCRRALGDLLKLDNKRPWEVLLCSDILGNRWRFVRGRPYPDGPCAPVESRSRVGQDTIAWSRDWRTQKSEGLWVARARTEDSARNKSQ